QPHRVAHARAVRLPETAVPATSQPGDADLQARPPEHDLLHGRVYLLPRGMDASSATAAVGSSAFTSISPTSTASKPARAMRAASSRDRIALSAIATTSEGTIDASRSPTVRSSANVPRP